MSKKRTSHESNADQDTNDDSDLTAFRPDDDARLAELAPLSGKTLEDLPIEIHQYILVKAVALEVNDMRLVKSVWEYKASLVIRRLQSVCPQWSNILATDFFQNELRRTLDRMAEAKIRLEILQQSPIQQHNLKVTTLKDEIFMHSWGKKLITVYDRNNIVDVKDVVHLPEISTIDIAACSIANCVYVLGLGTQYNCLSVSRITKDEEHQFSISPWISDLRQSFTILSVLANGSLLILSSEGGSSPAGPAVLSIYNENGFLQREMMLSSGIYNYIFGGNVLQKASGNLVLASLNDQRNTLLTEIDMSGSIVRQYQSTLCGGSAVNFADSFGRIVISDPFKRIELLDSEFNLLKFTGPQLNDRQPTNFHMLHYNRDNDEVVGVCAQSYQSSILSVFRFAEE